MWAKPSKDKVSRGVRSRSGELGSLRDCDNRRRTGDGEDDLSEIMARLAARKRGSGDRAPSRADPHDRAAEQHAVTRSTGLLKRHAKGRVQIGLKALPGAIANFRRIAKRRRVTLGELFEEMVRKEMVNEP